MRKSRIAAMVIMLPLMTALESDNCWAQDQGTTNRGAVAGQNPAGRAGGTAVQGTRETIGHALSMAIEASGLAMAARAGATGSGQIMGQTGGSVRRGGDVGDTNSRGDLIDANPSGASDTTGTSSPGGATGSGAGTSAGSGLAAGRGESAGSRTTGLAGQESYGGSQARSRASGSSASGSGVGNGSMNPNSYTGTQLLHHAMIGFQDSERLFREASRAINEGDPTLRRYFNAAQSYARTLEMASGMTAATATVMDRSATTGTTNRSREATSGTGEMTRAPSQSRQTSMRSEVNVGMAAIDPQTAYMVNHGVKEALDSCKLKTMCRLMGSSTDSVEVLRQHADRMSMQSRQLIQALAGNGNRAMTGSGGETSNATGATSGVRTSAGSLGGSAGIGPTNGAAGTGTTTPGTRNSVQVGPRGRTSTNAAGTTGGSTDRTGGLAGTSLGTTSGSAGTSGTDATPGGNDFLTNGATTGNGQSNDRPSAGASRLIQQASELVAILDQFGNE